MAVVQGADLVEVLVDAGESAKSLHRPGHGAAADHTAGIEGTCNTRTVSKQLGLIPRIRRAIPEDAAGIVAALDVVVAERIHSAIDRVWTVADERCYLEALSPREAIHVAVDDVAGVVGLQILDRWSSVLASMAHVGQVGTFLLPEWRGRGVGRQLWNVTLAFARDARYQKLVICVRGSNFNAQAFYRQLGFQDCGRLARQVMIDGAEDDEVLMELFVPA
jgi:ribosomal protein S18 acetylase RimI-like enzyme